MGKLCKSRRKICLDQNKDNAHEQKAYRGFKNEYADIPRLDLFVAGIKDYQDHHLNNAGDRIRDRQRLKTEVQSDHKPAYQRIRYEAYNACEQRNFGLPYRVESMVHYMNDRLSNDRQHKISQEHCCRCHVLIRISGSPLIDSRNYILAHDEYHSGRRDRKEQNILDAGCEQIPAFFIFSRLIKTCKVRRHNSSDADRKDSVRDLPDSIGVAEQEDDVAEPSGKHIKNNDIELNDRCREHDGQCTSEKEQEFLVTWHELEPELLQDVESEYIQEHKIYERGHKNSGRSMHEFALSIACEDHDSKKNADVIDSRSKSRG